MIDHPFVKLTKRQFELLKKMQDESEELFSSEGQVWVGIERTNFRTMKAFLRYCLISGDGRGNGAGTEGYFHLTGSAERYLAGERLIYEISNGKRGIKKVERIPIILWF